ncbi:MAG: hypothetical protein HY235_22100 [Acidobacteria bacterium]|nr:hypothetical protein [Acidobacteriota bacterium]
MIIPVKTLSGDSFNRLAKLLAVFNVKYMSDDKLRTIVVYAPKDVVAQMRRVVEELDRPGSEAAIGRNIEMTLALLRCSSKAPAEGRPLPADLDPVARQLRATTQYKDIQLWDVVPLHLQEGKDTDLSMRLPVSLPDLPAAFATVQIRIRTEAVSRRDSGRYVRFDRMAINFRIPYPTVKPVSPPASAQFQFMDVGLNTAGDFKEGQKTVLGKVSGLDDESAIFVVISLKVLD